MLIHALVTLTYRLHRKSGLYAWFFPFIYHFTKQWIVSLLSSKYSQSCELIHYELLDWNISHVLQSTAVIIPFDAQTVSSSVAVESLFKLVPVSLQHDPSRLLRAHHFLAQDSLYTHAFPALDL